MVFPAGGKPWPVEIGRTGRVVKRTIRGQRPQQYMTRAYDEAKAYVEVHLDEIFRRLVD
jgi:hypothetical protein